MITLSHDADIELDDGMHRYVQRVGNKVQLQKISTGQHMTVHVCDLPARLKELPDPSTVSPQALAHLSAADRKSVQILAAHIEEMISGAREGYESPRPEYDPATTTQNSRILSKGLEVKAAGLPSSRAQLYKLKRAYEEGGQAALIDGRSRNHNGPLSRADPRILEAVASVMAQRVNRSTVTERMLHDLVRKELIALHGENAPTAPEQTLYGYFRHLGIGKHITGKATSRRSRANSPQRSYGGNQRPLPGEEVQVDSTPMDMLIQTPDGPKRPILTIMIDIATRCIISSTIRLVGTKGYDHALLLARALTPRSNRPDASLHRTLIEARHPNVKLLTQAERAPLEAAHPFIYPRRIMMDNGKDYLSEVFESACRLHEIDLTYSSIHTPTDKAIVERTFHSIKTMFTQYLPGYVGDSPVNRGRNVEDEDLLDISTVNELFEDWVLSTWNYRPHGGLLDAFDPSIKYSPIQKFNAAAEFAGGIAVPLTTDQFIELLPSVYRKITRAGVEAFKRHYDAPELHPYRDRKSRNKNRDGKWEIKYNPYDAFAVWVKSPENTWIECRLRHSDIVASPHFAEINRNLRMQTSHRDEAAKEHAFFAGTAMPTATPDPLDPTDDTSEFDWSAPELAFALDTFDPDQE